ncbi:MAG: glycosyltransferase family 4 protein [bacterium]|nr:glycosyltransferase family 4 protein [bacterium]
MKVTLIHCSFIYTGGGERIVLEQLSHLKAAGYTVECYAPIVDFKNCFPDIIREYNIKTFLPQLPRWFPLRHAILLLLSCLLIPFFAFGFRKTDVFIGENQPGAWLAFVLARLLRKPYITFLNHPNRILYPREHEDWATVSDFKFLNTIFRYVKPILSYLDRISITGASKRFVNGYFIGQEIERIYHCDWIPCPSGTNYLENIAERTITLHERVEQRYSSVSDSFYPRRHFSYWDNQRHITMEQRKTHGNLVGGEIDNVFLSQHLLYSSDLSSPLMLNTSHNVNGFDITLTFILYTGRHQPWKRIDWLIESFSLLQTIHKRTNVYLVIPGSFTPHTLELRELAAQLGVQDYVVFLGDIDQEQLLALYRHATIYAFPSEREDFGIVVIEAMGQGLPVVAWNVGGPTDTVVDGVTGFLVSAYDKHQYSERLNELLEKPFLRLQMGKEGIARVREKFSWDLHVSVLAKGLTDQLTRQ